MKSPFRKKGRDDKSVANGDDEEVVVGEDVDDEMSAFIVDATRAGKRQRWKRGVGKRADRAPDKKFAAMKSRLTLSQRDSSDRGRSKQVVVLLDGDRTVVVKAKGQTIVSAEEVKHESPEVAAASAKKSAGRRPVVWHSGRQSFTLSDAPEMALHAKAEAVWALGIQQSIFKSSDPAASVPLADGRRGWLALTSPNRPKWADGGAVPGGFAVGKEDGAWLRVGWDAAEMSLVADGAVVGWDHLGDGIAVLEHQLDAMVPTGRRGADSQRALASEYHRQLLVSVDAALSFWQQNGLSARRIWLHGPGTEAPQELMQSLSTGTGLPVLAPELEGWEYPPTNHSWLTSAIAALEGDLPVWRSADRMRKTQQRKKVAKRLGIATAAALVFGGMWFMSVSEGSKIDDRIKDAVAREEAAQARSAANQALVESDAELEAAKKLAEMAEMETALRRAQGLEAAEGVLQDGDEVRAAALFSGMADWEALFEFWEMWFYAPTGRSDLYESGDDSIALVSPLGFSLSGDEWAFTFPGSGKSVDGNLALRETMDRWAAHVWGDCATTVSGPGVSVNSDGLSDLTVAIEPVMPCLLQRLAEMDELEATGEAEAQG